MANTFKFGNGNWAVKDGAALAYNDENNNFKPLPFDFTRASSATRVNREGLIEVVGQNKPRIDFTDNTSGHLLLEPSRTNYVPRSVFDAAVPTGWSIGFGTGTYDHELTTFMGQPAIKHTQLTSGRSFLQYGFSFLASTTYTCSFYADLANCGDIRSNETIVNIILDDDTGQTSVTFGEIDQDTGFASFTFTTGTDTFGYIRMGFGCAGTSDETNKPFVFSMPQVEIGSYATSYIPTENNPSGVTRSADKCFQGSLTDKGILNNSAITIYFETDIQSDTLTNYQEIIALYNDANNVNLRLETRTTNQLYVQHSGVYISGSNFNNLTLGSNSINLKKIAIYLTTTQFKIFADGSQLYSTYNGSYNLDFDRIGFRSYNNLVETLIKNKEIKLYNTALSDSELQALTS